MIGIIHSIIRACAGSIAVGDKTQGPYTTEQVQQMRKEGSVTDKTLVWKKGMADWKKCADVAELNVTPATTPVAAPVSLSTDPIWSVPPLGLMLETPEQVVAAADKINARAVVTQTMPLGNPTGMTEQERALIGLWIAQGKAVQ